MVSETKVGPGDSLRGEVEEVGTALAETLTSLLGSLPGRPGGPQALSDLLGITVVTASRLLRAIDQADPLAVVQQLPGAVPLRRTIEAARQEGARKDRVKAAKAAVEAFESLIRRHAGDRSALTAMLTDWLPQGRKEFEVRRRQSVYKAMSELRGVSCKLDLATIFVQPSKIEDHLDLLSIQGSFGIDRIRPDAVVQFGSQRLNHGNQPVDRHPASLDGQPLDEDVNAFRLDQFCSATPAPLVAKQHGDEVLYTLGQTGFGPQSSVDLVLAELDRAELRTIEINETGVAPYFYQIVATPSRAMLFDLLIHRDAHPEGEARMMVYDTSVRGPARAGAPEREVDLLRISEDIEYLGFRRSRLRYSGFPRYQEMLDHAMGKLGWNADEFRAYRIQMSYPLPAMQVCMAMRPGSR